MLDFTNHQEKSQQQTLVEEEPSLRLTLHDDLFDGIDLEDYGHPKAEEESTLDDQQIKCRLYKVPRYSYVFNPVLSLTLGNQVLRH